MKLTYEQVLDLLPAYALGALEGEEEAAVNEYLQLQRGLLQSLTRAEVASTLLAQGTSQASMAPDAQDRMMERIRADLPADFEAQTFENGDARIEPAITVRPSGGSRRLLPTGNGQANVSQGSTEQAGADQKQSEPLVQNRQPPARRRGRNTAVPANQPRRLQPAPRGRTQGAVQPRGGRRPPPNLFPAPPRRSGFGTRAFINATMAASLVTLVFMTLLNFQSEQQLRQFAVDLRDNNARLVQSESRIDTLNDSNASLTTANTSLIEQNGTLLASQSALAEENEALAAEAEQMQTARSALLTEYSGLEDENTNIAIERAALAEEITRLQNQIDAASQRIALVGGASQAIILTAADDGSDDFQATFFQSESDGAIVVQGLEPLPTNQTYQLWLVTPQGDQISGGLFSVDGGDEPTWADLALPSSVPQISQVGVSIEPSDGSDEPTGPMILESLPLIFDEPETVG